MTERPLTIVSLNVKGLGRDSTKQKLIKTWLSSLQNPPQILLIQEHHLDEQGTTNSTKGIEFWQGRAFWNPGIPMGNSQRISAGTAILVDRVTTPLVKEDRIIIEGRTQFLTLHLPDSTELSIINTYAPRASKDRATLWKKIREANLTTEHVIIGGDFNHMEEEEARGKAGERRMHRREAASWHHLTLQYGLLDAWTLDSFRKMSKKEYTFDNGRKGQGSAVSRIDKFLVSQELDARGGRIEAAPSMRKIFDHSPLVITIWGRPSSTPTAIKYFDTTLLREDRSKAAILDAWRGTQPPPSLDADWPRWLEAATRRVLACNGRLAREKRGAKGARIKELQHKIRLAEIQLQSNPEDEPVRDILSVAQGHLTDSLQEQVVRNHQLSAATWFRYGDTCSKRFFDFHRIGRKRSLLKELSTEDRDVTG
jgi:exonuclease III